MARNLLGGWISFVRVLWVVLASLSLIVVFPVFSSLSCVISPFSRTPSPSAYLALHSILIDTPLPLAVLSLPSFLLHSLSTLCPESLITL